MTFVINYFRYAWDGFGPCERHPRENKLDDVAGTLVAKATRMARKNWPTFSDRHAAGPSTTYAMRGPARGSFGVNNRALAAYDYTGLRRRGTGGTAKMGRNARIETDCLFVEQPIAQKQCSLQSAEEKVSLLSHWRLSFSKHPHNSCYTPRPNDF